jgi:beta-lactam-binding protein with PASTA domain
MGDTETTAVSTLQTAKLNPVVICQSTADPTQDGLVQSQSPSGGVSVNSGTTVDITVANLAGCSGATTTTTIPPTTTTTH